MSPKFQVDHRIDLLDLLSSERRDYVVGNKPDGADVSYISSLMGFPLLVCAFRSTHDDDDDCDIAMLIQVLWAFASKLEDDELGRFNIVVVVNQYDYDAFEKFRMRHISQNCLIVPFWDTDSRWEITGKLLDHQDEDEKFGVLAVDSSGTVIENDFHCFFCFGTLLLPFTQENMFLASKLHLLASARIEVNYHERLGHQLRYLFPSQLVQSPMTLSHLIKAKKVKHIVSGRKCSVSRFNDKVVGIFVYYDGASLNRVNRVQQACNTQGQPLEIVLIPHFLQSNPRLFFDNIVKPALEQLSITTWWSMVSNDYDTDGVRRLLSSMVVESTDHLIILPHQDGLGDLHALGVMTHYGGPCAYPFTKEAIVAKKIAALRGFDMFGYLKRECRIRTLCPTLIYFDYPDHRNPLAASLEDFVLQACNIVVVYVPLNSPSTTTPQFPWPVVSFEMGRPIVEALFLKNQGFQDENEFATIMSFSSTGVLLSRQASCFLIDDPPSLFKDHLYSETLQDIAELVNL